MKLESLKYLIKEGLRNLWVNRLMTVASVGVLICCMLLVGGSYIFSQNIYTTLKAIESKNTIQVFFKKDATDEQAKEQLDKAKKITNVATARLITKDEGLEELKKTLGDSGDLLDYKDDNPLVHKLVVSVEDLSKYDDVVYQLEKLENVEKITDQREVAGKLTSIREIIMLFVVWIIGLFLLVSLFILSNTVKLTMYARRLEIGIMRSVGATNAFIKLPFVVEGVLIGIIAGVLTEGIVWYVYRSVINGIEKSLNIPLVPFKDLWYLVFAGFLIVGVFIGAVGSLISIRRYLKEEGSEMSVQ